MCLMKILISPNVQADLNLYWAHMLERMFSDVDDWSEMPEDIFFFFFLI